MPRISAAQGEAHISQAVWETVAERGIEGTTIRSVAERAGRTSGMIMHRFGTREHMLRHARGLLFERTAARADAAEASTSEPAEKLLLVLEGVLTLDDARRQEARVWTGFAAASIALPGLREVHIAGARAWSARIRRLLLDCVGTADEARLEHGAAGLIACTEGLALMSSLDAESYSPSVQRASLRDAIADALRRLSAESRRAPSDRGRP